MDWEEKIEVGMKLIKEGCTLADNCFKCPFENFCCEFDNKIPSDDF